jgi:putative phosphoesterase
MNGRRYVIGLIADTHGQVRPECARALTGVELILHAGDVGGAHVLEELGRIAPVRAVCGNTDLLTSGLPAAVDLEVDGVSIHVSHGHELGAPTPTRLVERYGADVVVYGHTHRALVERIGRQLIVNPGAAGPARFRFVPSVARLVIADGAATVDLVALV